MLLLWYSVGEAGLSEKVGVFLIDELIFMRLFLLVGNFFLIDKLYVMAFNLEELIFNSTLPLFFIDY